MLFIFGVLYELQNSETVKNAIRNVINRLQNISLKKSRFFSKIFEYSGIPKVIWGMICTGCSETALTFDCVFAYGAVVYIVRVSSCSSANTARISMFFGALQTRDPGRSSAPKNIEIREEFAKLQPETPVIYPTAP